MRALAQRARRLLAERPPADAPPPADPLEGVDADDRPIIRRALPHTMTGVPRLQALVDAVRHVERRGLPGDFVECGVWRGGSVLAMVHTLQQLGRADRAIHLYDTFEGMTEPTALDTSAVDRPALDEWREAQGRGEHPWNALFGPEVLDEGDVRARVLATGYPADRLHFVRGRVEDTIPGHAPDAIALLRLDTDWYESTRHELEHLYPRLCSGGVLIVDDYGHWDGARRAVDEFFAAHGPAPLLTRIDYTGRIAVKP